MHDFGFHFVNFKVINNGYLLILIGTCTALGGREVEFEYIGTELNIKGSIPDEIREKLRKELNNDYGYAKFDKNEVKNQFNKKRSYYIDYDREQEVELE